MNTVEMLNAGYQHVLDAVSELDDNAWTISGACGHWSIKDIVAHLTSYHRVLLDALNSLVVSSIPTTNLDSLLADYEEFNADEVSKRSHWSSATIMEEYAIVHAAIINQLAWVPAAALTERGALAWYGDSYDVEDFIVYTIYAHIREHCGQIAVFRDHLPEKLTA